MTYADERYRKPPTLADADALRAIRRDVETRRLMRELIAALASLYAIPKDSDR